MASALRQMLAKELGVGALIGRPESSRVGLGIQVLPSSEGLSGTPRQYMRSFSPYMVRLSGKAGGGRGAGEGELFSSTYAQDMRCDEWGLCEPLTLPDSSST